MSDVHATVVVNAPVESVFDAYARYDRHPDWQPGLLRAEITTDGPIAPGTRGLEVRRMLGREVGFPYEITEHDAPYRSAFRTLEGPIRPSGVASFASTNSQTRMDFTMQLGAQGALRLLSRLLVPAFNRQTRADLQRFKAMVEQQPHPHHD